MKLSEVMQNPRLKVARANQHIAELEAATRVVPRELYELTVGPSFTTYAKSEPDCFEILYRPTAAIPQHFGATVGDVVNNLRAPFDYFVRRAVACKGVTRNLYFPFAEHYAQLRSSKNFGTLDRVFTELAEFIFDEIAPCRDKNLHLWAVSNLCNDDKHDDILPIATMFDWRTVNLRVGRDTLASLGVRHDASKRYVLSRSNMPISINGEHAVSIDLKFPPGALFEGQLVIPTLKELSRTVTAALDALEIFIAPYCSR